MNQPTHRPWTSERARAFDDQERRRTEGWEVPDLDRELHALVSEDERLRATRFVNLDPASNVMNPAAERLLARGLGTRPSLGDPGDKHEAGLAAISRIESMARRLVEERLGARYAELRFASGSMANAATFLATTSPGDPVIVPPPQIGGHVTHHVAGAAGVLGLTIHYAPIDADRYTVDVDALRRMALEVRPRSITVGGSLNLTVHPVAQLREIADQVGATLMFDAAHLIGMIAGGAWPHPLREGAHVMTASTYKSLGGPPSGVVVTDDPDLARRIEALAFPALSANHDVGKTAALARTMLDWRVHGSAYAAAMRDLAAALAEALVARGLPVHLAGGRPTVSHQFAVRAGSIDDARATCHRLEQAGLLTTPIDLPPLDGAPAAGVRMGTPELVRWGVTTADAGDLADLIAGAWNAVDARDLDRIAADVATFRGRFGTLHFVT